MLLLLASYVCVLLMLVCTNVFKALSNDKASNPLYLILYVMLLLLCVNVAVAS